MTPLTSVFTLQINGGHAFSNHVVVTPHGRTVGEAGGGARGPTDVVDTGGQNGLNVSTSHYPPMTRGSIAGYTGKTWWQFAGCVFMFMFVYLITNIFVIHLEAK